MNPVWENSPMKDLIVFASFALKVPILESGLVVKSPAETPVYCISEPLSPASGSHFEFPANADSGMPDRVFPAFSC